jgi:copper chaperone CopZ
MNKQFLLPLVTAAFVAFGAPAYAHGNDHHAEGTTDQTETFQVKGMVCHGCVQTVTANLKAAAGVKRVHVDLKSGTATVTYAGAKTGYQKLSRALNGAFKLQQAPKSQQPVQP